VEIQQGSIENMSIADESVDAIFSYSVIFMTDYRKTLREFYRILKPNGKLYFTVNGLGWYLYCLIEEHNKSDMYDPRQMAISSLDSTINYFADERNKSVNASDQLIIPIDVLTKELIELGFDTPIVNYEGKINVTNEPANQSFYQKETYSNKPFIHEVLVTKV
jgi:SAM-dependent methyltransferase